MSGIAAATAATEIAAEAAIQTIAGTIGAKAGNKVVEKIAESKEYKSFFSKVKTALATARDAVKYVWNSLTVANAKYAVTTAWNSLTLANAKALPGKLLNLIAAPFVWTWSKMPARPAFITSLTAKLFGPAKEVAVVNEDDINVYQPITQNSQVFTDRSTEESEYGIQQLEQKSQLLADRGLDNTELEKKIDNLITETKDQDNHKTVVDPVAVLQESRTQKNLLLTQLSKKFTKGATIITTTIKRPFNKKTHKI